MDLSRNGSIIVRISRYKNGSLLPLSNAYLLVLASTYMRCMGHLRGHLRDHKTCYGCYDKVILLSSLIAILHWKAGWKGIFWITRMGPSEACGLHLVVRKEPIKKNMWISWKEGKLTNSPGWILNPFWGIIHIWRAWYYFCIKMDYNISPACFFLKVRGSSVLSH